MILGAMNIPRVVEKSRCKTSEDYLLTDIGDYKIWSSVCTPYIEFAKAKEVVDQIDKSIFINDQDTKLNFASTTKVQNYLTTRFIGRVPYTYYGPKTKMGEEFILLCSDGDPSYPERKFGTTEAFSSNSNAAELITYAR